MIVMQPLAIVPTLIHGWDGYNDDESAEFER